MNRTRSRAAILGLVGSLAHCATAPPSDGGRTDAPFVDVRDAAPIEERGRNDAEPDVTADIALDAVTDEPIAADVLLDATPDAPPDTSRDGARDAALDAGVDAARDAARDARPEAAIDAGLDARADASLDVSVDALRDGAVDVMGDAAPAARYYVAPWGSDRNAGTVDAPFASCEKLASVLRAGDLAYLRGGTYRSARGAAASVHCAFDGLAGTEARPIRIWAYPGERPVLDLNDIVPSATDPTAVTMHESHYVHLRGLRVTGLRQHTGGAGISRGFDLADATHNTIEQVEVDHIGGFGFTLSNGADDNVFRNCDAHHMDDRYSDPDPWGGANGFQATGGSTATRNTFEGCRAWWISDDGFDFYRSNGVFTLRNNWSFWNGYEPGSFTARGNGVGFKLGPNDGGATHTQVLRLLIGNVAFENRTEGFSQNDGDLRFVVQNNTSFRNGTYGFMWDFVAPAPLQDFRNNVSFRDPLARRGAETNGSFNSWNLASSLTVSDFASVDSSGVDGPRGADGSLPRLPFLRPTASSRLRNAGTDVGRASEGSAPDLGAFEYE